MSQLFTPIKIGRQSLDNRLVIPPMCQYSAKDGLPTDWHLMHYGSLSHSGAGLMIMEATAICPAGRLSPFDLGLWSDDHQLAMKKLLDSIRQYSPMPIAVQLVHAGRKASMSQPWQNFHYVKPADGGWQTVAPSAIPVNDNYGTPVALSKNEIQAIITQFAQSAIYADKAGFDMIEIHAAHGYLLHQFLSPIANQRTDEYGDSLENRIRIVIEVYQAIRAVLPTHKAVGIRISATDWIEHGWDLSQSLVLCQKLAALGCSYIHVSSGGLSDAQQIPVGPNYQVNFAQAIKSHIDIPVIAVGLITEAIQAEAIVSTGQADMVAVGRGMLYNPHWGWQAAETLQAQVIAPPQYLCSTPHGVKNLFK
ncbi:NADH:flavin oxidoreductase/NADH oxidase [Utexia brackfieldae]|uniref:NADH:flavin oxidoreductase/NADH oxidase n=1 Tax=Utexia brackfieldae TaxID=3074108 RepID=UPI00370DD4CB